MKTFLMAVAAMMTAAAVAVPCEIVYGGILESRKSETKTFEFRLYPASEGGDLLWARAIDVVSDSEGNFTVVLSDDAGAAVESAQPRYRNLYDVVRTTSDGALYLELATGGVTYSTRQRIAGVIRAAFALDAPKAAGDFTAAGRFAAKSLVAGECETSATSAVFSVSATGDVRSSGRIRSQEGLRVGGNANVEGSAVFSTILSVSGDLSANSAVVSNSLACASSSAASLSAGSITRNGYGVGLPVGAVILWDGASIPKDWALCNGQNGTPNLVDRFVPAAGGDYTVNSTGGSDAITLKTENLPQHTHTVTYPHTGYSGKHNESREVIGWRWDVNHQNFTSTSAGGGKPHENRPPYYALYYIMKIK